MKQKKIFIFLIIFWALIIGGFIGFKEYTLQSGEEVVLDTVPVDPRDLFRGDYVILRYTISDINLVSVKSDLVNVKPGDNAYIILEKGEKETKVLEVAGSAPKDQLFIKGKIRNVYENRISLEYGIESYFVPENKGRAIERNRNIDVKVAIDKFGNAIIKNLIIDGKDISFK